MTSQLNKDKPSQKEIVEVLMKKMPDTCRDVVSRRTGAKRLQVPHLVFTCPKGNSCRSSGTVVFEKSKGYTNPYSHLRACLSNGSEDHLLGIYEDAICELRAKNNVRGRLSFMPASIAISEREKAMHAYMRLIIMNNYPVSHTQDAELRSFCKYDSIIGRNDFRLTMFQLVELVEAEIKKELAGTQGAIMYDGWSESGTHFLGVYAVFMRSVPYLSNGNRCFREELAMPLLSLSPMAQVTEDSSDSSGEATEFDAATHLRQLEDVFSYYGVNVHRWTLCTIGDNASVNRRLANLLEVPHIGCCNHKLSLEVQKMVGFNNSLSFLLKSVHETMSNCTKRLRNRAMLRNLTSLSPVLDNVTRWSSKFKMLCRFNRIREQLLQVADKEGTTVSVNRSVAFRNRAIKYERQMSIINHCTVKMQKRGYSLSDCRFVLDTLIEQVEEFKDDPSHDLYDCSLGTHYIEQCASISTHPIFESAVIKIQRRETDLLTDAEKNASVILLSSSDGSNHDSSTFQDDRNVSFDVLVERKKRRRLQHQGAYRNCDFILGSIAEVERLWSIAKNVRTVNRKVMTPILFEAIMFLKINKDLWDQCMVSDAMSRSRNESVNQRLDQDEEQLDLIANCS